MLIHPLKEIEDIRVYHRVVQSLTASLLSRVVKYPQVGPLEYVRCSITLARVTSYRSAMYPPSSKGKKDTQEEFIGL
jgi:hypothetical protein